MLAGLIGGVVLLVLFCVVETKVDEPMFRLGLFRNRAFALGNLAGLLSSMGRGGLQFMLIIWLQGIWLPLHGYSFESTPLWAGIYLLPLTVGFVASGPVSGWLSDKYGTRLFAGTGLLIVAATFIGLLVLPVDFGYGPFAILTFLNGVGSGMFASPNTAQIMNAVPAEDRGAAAGMRGTFFNAGSSLSIGVFFSLMIIGLAAHLPTTLTSGLQAHGVPNQVAQQIGQLPPGGQPVRRVPRVQPGRRAARPHRRAAPAAAAAGRDAHREHLLPPAHLRALPRRPRGRLRRGRGDDGHRRDRLVRHRAPRGDARRGGARDAEQDAQEGRSRRRRTRERPRPPAPDRSAAPDEHHRRGDPPPGSRARPRRSIGHAGGGGSDHDPFRSRGPRAGRHGRAALRRRRPAGALPATDRHGGRQSRALSALSTLTRTARVGSATSPAAKGWRPRP